jgi:hypothetical protein
MLERKENSQLPTLNVQRSTNTLRNVHVACRVLIVLRFLEYPGGVAEKAGDNEHEYINTQPTGVLSR